MSEDRDAEILRLRAQLALLEAEAERDREHSSKPEPTSGGQTSTWRGGAFLMVALFGITLLLVAISQCSAPDVEAPADPKMSPSTAQDDTEPSEPPPDWRYSERRDPMTDRITHTACTTSTNKALLTWPYSPVSADLCIRQSPEYGLDVYVALNGDGQIICQSYRNCIVRIRFGEGSQQSFSAADASDGSSNIVFVTNARRFVEAAKTADTIKVQLTFYQAGDQVLMFDTANLEWPRPSTP